jgi:hypothetical protein
MNWNRRTELITVSMTAVVLLLTVFAAQGQSADGNVLRPRKLPVIGVVHRNIAESSPVAKATISIAQSANSKGSGPKIHFGFQNVSDHDLFLFPGNISYEVRDDSGKLPPESEIGCESHFFSPCFTDRMPSSHKSTFTFPAHAVWEWDDVLSQE